MSRRISRPWAEYLRLFDYHNELEEHLWTGHRVLYDSMDKDHTQFEHEFEELINGVELKAKTLGEGCRHCVNLHNKKDSKLLQRLLSTYSEDNRSK